MRYPTDRKEETHRRIVESASRVFRSKGFDGIGIAKLMAALDLTHGGFYAHFADKEALMGEASVLGLDQSEAMMLEAIESGGLPALLDLYLGEGHRSSPELGCVLPALASEVARRSGASRASFTARLAELLATLSDQMPGETQAERLGETQAMLASMVGAVTLARAVSDPALAADILRSTRERLLDRLA